ncbi:hypothetical protein P7C70_g8537, partial [Phenoliferia sp. Uapishka_3]
MAPHALSATLISLLALSASAVADQHLAQRGVTQAPHATITARAVATQTTSPLPLTDYTYAYSAVVNPFAVGRGPQSGYNQADAQCQTAIINSVSDFCLWGSPGTSPNGTIGDVEAAVVAYCVKSGHGARIMPAGTITAVQFMKTPGYIQVVGRLNQTGLNLAEDDSGGELDPHGADLLGNPLGGLVYSTGLPSGDNTTYQQAISWNNFVGGGVFCFKLCDPSYSTDKNYCQNIYDLIGCNYNMPAAYTENTFLSCEGDLQDEVATYTSAGATYTWSQPSLLPATSTLPWTPRIPASSNCVTYQSTDLFPASALGYMKSSALVGSAATTTSGASAASATSGGSTRSGSLAGAAKTGSSGSSGSSSAAATATKAASASSVGATSFGIFAALLAVVAMV